MVEPAPDTKLAGGAALYYYDREIQANAAKVLPGEYLATSRDIALVTLLGSCVSACLRDPGAGIGGMNHFMLPRSSGGPASESARYGAFAMEVLLNELLKRGASRSRMEAKIFGGGAVLRGFTTGDVGEKNCEFVREYLARERIPIAGEDLLGIHPRKVFFFPQSGRTLVKRLMASRDGEVQQLERLYVKRLEREPAPGGDVELF